MLDVLSRILGDRVEASVQADHFLDRLIPEHTLLSPCLDLPELRHSFPDHAVQPGPLLYL